MADEMEKWVEVGCRGVYGSTWDGPPDKMPGPEMKAVWRKHVRKVLEPVRPLIEASERWRSVADYLPPEYETFLTQHEDDIFPIAAFHMGGIWLREIEGSEDVPAIGKHEELRRPPTHWRPLPRSPRSTVPDQGG